MQSLSLTSFHQLYITTVFVRVLAFQYSFKWLKFIYEIKIDGTYRQMYIYIIGIRKQLKWF